MAAIQDPQAARHVLMVPEHPDDDIEIEHPDDCPLRAGDLSSPGHEYVQYACSVAEQEAYAGLPWRHRDASPGLITSEALAPGRYPLAYVADGDRSGLVLADVS